MNETFARKMWGAMPAIGQRFILWGRLTEVVGVAEDGKYHDLEESPQPVVYLPLSQSEQGETVFRGAVACGAESRWRRRSNAP